MAASAPAPGLSYDGMLLKHLGDARPPAAGGQSDGPRFSPAYLSVLGILLAAIVLVVYYYCFVLHFNCLNGEQRRRRRQVGFAGAHDSESGEMRARPSLHCPPKKGLDEEAIRSIPTCKYHSSSQQHQQQQQQQQQQHPPPHHVNKPIMHLDHDPPDSSNSGAAGLRDYGGGGGGRRDADPSIGQEENAAVMCSDCAVCLGSFREAEILRQLPACRHAFHIACVDKWLSSCSDCPLCRTIVVAPAPPPPPPPPRPAPRPNNAHTAIRAAPDHQAPQPPSPATRFAPPQQATIAQLVQLDGAPHSAIDVPQSSHAGVRQR